MNRTDIADEIHVKSGLSRQKSEEVLQLMLDAISNALKAGVEVKLRNFGTFSVRRSASRVARNPQTGEEVIITERLTPVFKPSSQLKQLIRR